MRSEQVLASLMTILVIFAFVFVADDVTGNCFAAGTIGSSAEDIESEAGVDTARSVEESEGLVSPDLPLHVAAMPAPPVHEMVTVPKGEFTMGCDSGYPCGPSEDPEHVVYLDEFWIRKYEVTNRDYCDKIQWAYDNGYVTATSSSAQDAESGKELLELEDSECEISYSGGTFIVDPGKEEHPVIEVSWYGGACYCDWLSIREGLSVQYDHSDWSCAFNASGYRLPTEAEWEKASRGIDFRKYPWGDDEPDCSYLNYSNCEGWTVPVGSYTPKSDSPYGGCDMSGNVWEWCNDRYDGEYYSVSPYINPRGPAGGGNRVLRGGSWPSFARYCRSANRYRCRPGYTDYLRGFRLVRAAF